ncbi:cobalamin synthase [Xanthomonas oryzae]|uniref:Adenosylcobinamide-GDP ribazoletransferase n=1 Tax=Xanthomonas oryzae TaxID=347 RepID=A0AAP0ZKC3_9XANT|nr:adenosylcobinamide-GDP ribazoletransferase [Xanthomonas oryzae]KOR42104.1 cobalamin synthase [Xanthomonas oryzae]QBG83105.1 adenosylcobinamide-GDP ribazoletransferase [Xanthomonas oryzae]
MIDGLLAAVGFLTRIPVPGWVFARPGAQARSLLWYPLVGVLIGAVLSALAWCLRDVAPLLGAVLLLSSWVWLTGALHIDGLADTADAWVGGMGDRMRTLAIMKDPTSGPMAVAAVVLALLLKCAALATLLPAASDAVWLAPLLARTALVAAFLTTPYVRAGGLGRGLVGSARAGLLLSLLLGLGCAFAAGVARGMLACVVAGVVFVLWRRACLRRLGGMTGDTCGALAEVSETAVLVALALQAS